MGMKNNKEREMEREWNSAGRIIKINMDGEMKTLVRDFGSLKPETITMKFYALWTLFERHFYTNSAYITFELALVNVF